MADDQPNFGVGLKGEDGQKLDEFGLAQKDYVKAALNWQYNWIGMAGAATFALISGTGLPLILAAGLELMYVAVLPQNSRFRRLVRSWKYADDKKRHERRMADMYKELPPELQSRYAHVRWVCDNIRANYAKLSFGSQMFARQMEDKLSGLLQAYIRLLTAAHTQREYLNQTNPKDIQREIEQLERSFDKQMPKVKEINQRRIEILRKRVEKFEKIGENQQIVWAQCAAMEDVLKLIRDQSVTMKDPQQVSDQLESLVQDVEQTEQNVREMEAIFDMASPEANAGLTLPEAAEPAPQASDRRRSKA